MLNPNHKPNFPPSMTFKSYTTSHMQLINVVDIPYPLKFEFEFPSSKQLIRH